MVEYYRDNAFVQSIWDSARTARLSELYYGEQVDALGRSNFLAELLVLIAASGSGIAGWAVWQGQIGGTAWAMISGLAALLAVAKPLLAFDRKIRDGARQQQLYRTILGGLENLAFDIEQAGGITPEHRRRFQRAHEQLRQAETNDVAAPRLKTRERLMLMVNREMPPESLWMPEHAA